MAICWERVVLLAFYSCCFILCRLNCIGFFPVWCLGQDVELNVKVSGVLYFSGQLYFFGFLNLLVEFQLFEIACVLLNDWTS